MQQLHVACIGCAAVEDLGRDGHVSGEFGDRRVFQIAQPRPEFTVGQEEVPQSLLAGLGLQPVDDGGHRPAIGRSGELSGVLRLTGAYVRLDEGGRLVVKVSGTVGEGIQANDGHTASSTTILPKCDPDASSASASWNDPSPLKTRCTIGRVSSQ